MDTPQVTAELLNSDWGSRRRRARAERGRRVLGDRPARRSTRRRCSPASRCRPTGPARAQLARLERPRVVDRLLPPLRDVDRPADAEQIGYHYPALRFSERYGEIDLPPAAAAGRPGLRPALPERRRRSRPGPGAHDRTGARANPLTLDTARWRNAASAVRRDGRRPLRATGGRSGLRARPDGARRCSVPGGRPSASTSRRRPSAESRLGGGLALRRRIRSTTARRRAAGARRCCSTATSASAATCRALLRTQPRIWWRAGGLIICEVDRSPDRDDAHEVELSTANALSEPFGWAAVGARTVQRVAATSDMVVAEEWRADHRVFVTLRTASADGAPADRCRRRWSATRRGDRLLDGLARPVGLAHPGRRRRVRRPRLVGPARSSAGLVPVHRDHHCGRSRRSACWSSPSPATTSTATCGTAGCSWPASIPTATPHWTRP